MHGPRAAVRVDREGPRIDGAQQLALALGQLGQGPGPRTAAA
ncbi:hypothetical protein [Nannocystis pusilla]